jgi:hypothetical protein
MNPFDHEVYGRSLNVAIIILMGSHMLIGKLGKLSQLDVLWFGW